MQNDVDVVYQVLSIKASLYYYIIFYIKVLQFVQYSIKHLFHFIRKTNLVGSKVCIVHVHVTPCIKRVSTVNITIGYDTSDLLCSSSSSLPHTKTPDNSFSYQYKCMHTQTSSDLGPISSKYKSNINDIICPITSASCAHP